MVEDRIPSVGGAVESYSGIWFSRLVEWSGWLGVKSDLNSVAVDPVG